MSEVETTERKSRNRSSRALKAIPEYVRWCRRRERELRDIASDGSKAEVRSRASKMLAQHQEHMKRVGIPRADD